MTNDLINELSQNFIEYAVAVNTDRSIPDAKCGLKPVARRILFGSLHNGYTNNKAHVKCAKIVGDVMGQLHPHGDSSIYGALVRLAQPWVMRYPLMDFHGNLGNIGGDGPAAYRYTEARLSKLAEDGMLAGLKKNNVPFTANYDETIEEPVTLPAAFPNLLCNPNSGIGVAMSCNWASHNLREVATAIYQYLDGNEPMLPGPDFPTGGVIINKDDIPGIMKTGHGSVKIRGKYKIDKQDIIFYEIPYGTSTESLIEEIGKACDAKEVDGVDEVINSSSKGKLNIVIRCDRAAVPEVVVKQLFAKTNLQTSFSYNQVALVDKVPTELNLEQCIEIYVNHNIECIIKETEFDLNKANDRLEIVNGLLKALEDIDNIIALIKASDSAAAAKINLINKYKFTENQAKAILAMRLSSLAKLEKVELEKEAAELIETIKNLKYILSNRQAQEDILRKNLSNLVKKYGDDRRTELTQIALEPKVKKEVEEVMPEDVVVVVTKSGDVKRIARASFRAQNRAGRGVKTIDDVVLDTISTNTVDTLMIFTNKGKLYRLLVDKVPIGTNASKGTNLAGICNFEPTERICAVSSLHRDTNAEYVIFFTKQGVVKKTKLQEYMDIKKTTGIQAIKFKEGDELVDVTFIKDEDLMIVTKNGLAIRFNSTSITPIGRVATGVRGVKLDDGDYVIAGLPIGKKKYLAVFSEKGLSKMTEITEYPVQLRGGKGIYTYKPSTATGELIAAILINKEDSVLITGKPNSICVAAADIPVGGRIALGNIMIKNSKVSNVVKL